MDLKHQIKEAVKVLKEGGIVAYPTDTVYGLAVDVNCRHAVRNLFLLKKRSFNKPVAVAVGGFKQIEQFCRLSQTDQQILRKLLPGPYTFLLRSQKTDLDLINSGGLIGIRFPDSKHTKALIAQFGRPITATSANLGGASEPVKDSQIGLKTDYVIKGRCRLKQPSTIINLVEKKIVRAGAGLKDAKKLLGI